MAMSATPPDQERALITRRDPKRRYGAKVVFQLLHSASIGELDNVTLLLDSGKIATIEPAQSASWEGGKRFEITLEGFRTATEAETEGLRLSQSLLLTAISLNFGLRLNYRSQEPALVYDRFPASGIGITVQAEGVTGWGQSIVLDQFMSAYTDPPLARSLLLSMELYCAAFLELNERARFVTVVSALEPLATQEDLGLPVSSFVDGALAALEQTKGIEEGVRSSLRGRLSQLRQESVRQALLRLSDSWFPQRTDVRQRIDRAYGLRSELLHEGTLLDPDVDLATEITQISHVLRAIYEQASGRKFRVPPQV